MSQWQQKKGLHSLGNGCHAWLAHEGGWGWSNAGLIHDAGESLLVDTLFDLPRTSEMLQAMRDAVPAAKDIGALVNTHGNGDHTFGNQLIEGARIIASRNSIEDTKHRPPEQYQQWAREWRDMGMAGKFWWEVIGSRFDFSGIRMTLPTETFDGSMTLQVGGKVVHLVEVGPAHTKGDVLVYVPQDRIVYTGDILFVGGHPAIWAGPVSNWIRACDLILSWDVEAVVPGHGPITDKDGVRHFKAYLEYLLQECRRCQAEGMNFQQAAESLSLDRWADWGESERIYVNVHACYREILGDAMPKPQVLDMLELFGKRYFSRCEACETGLGRHG